MYDDSLGYEMMTMICRCQICLLVYDGLMMGNPFLGGGNDDGM